MRINNLNDLAKAVTAKEGMKQPLSIAQVKEVLRCLCDLVAESPKVFVILGRAALKRRQKGAKS